MANFTLTTNADTVAGGAADDTVNATAATLNASDSLTGGPGFDTLALSGSGFFRVDQLATFAGFERIRLDNTTSDNSYLIFGGGQPIEVDATGMVFIEVDSPSNWNGSNIINGDATGTSLYFSNGGAPSQPKVTYDLTSNVFSHVKISLFGSTVLVNSATMAGIQSVGGDSVYDLAHVVTADSTLDLTHTTVNMGHRFNGSEGVGSTNALGTTFTVSDQSTAMEIYGGPGQDTLVATGFTLDASQRRIIFLGTSIEKIIDSTGIYGGPGADTFVFDPTALPPSGPAIVSHIVDFDQGNSGTFNQAEGDTLDLSALLSAGSGQPVGNLVRVLENSSTGAIVQVDKDGTANGTQWTTIALLDGVHTGNGVKVIFDASQPAATVTVIEQAGSVAINDVTITEGNSGAQLATFTVTRSGGTAAFDVNFATSDNSATVSDSDYVANAGTLHFDHYVNTQTISVTINGDTKFESDEAFLVNLSGATNGASISDGQGVGTISNDDADPAWHFAPLVSQIAAFAPGAGGWSSDNQFPRELADVNGDGVADIVGFGAAGAYVSIGDGNGSFGPLAFRLAQFGSDAGGWSSQDKFPRELADVNGDHMADIVGFGIAGVYVSLATGGGSFGPITFSLAQFGSDAGGWSSQDKFPRELADVNGDGMADIVGFGAGGVYVSLATGGGSFGPLALGLNQFGVTAGGWSSQDRFPRELADVNGDHMADIVGFGADGVYVSLATGGGSFGPLALAVAQFGVSAGGWSSNDTFPRELADINGDGKVDIVGFGAAGVYLALGNGDGSFRPLAADLQQFGTVAGGWASEDKYPRHLADVNHDGAADIVGFGYAGVYEALSHDFHLI